MSFLAFLLNPRVLVTLALVAGVAFTHFMAFRKGKQDVRNEWAVSVASANDEARRLERARQRMADEAARTAADREAGIRAAAARAARDVRGLRDDLSAANDYAKQSGAAAQRVASVATDLLGRCTAAYLDVAEAAARADSEARELRQAWPQ